MSIQDNSHLATSKKVVCTQHTLRKISAFKELDPEKKDYYLDTCFDVGKCGALAVEKPHYHYCVPKITWVVKTDICIKSN